jgi:thioesterase domain-containing protein
VPTVEELAQRHVAALRRKHPTGPVHLLGACFGGVVALEMATQLERSGRPVALLVMINCFNRAWRRMYPEASPVAVRSRHLLRRVRFHGRNLRQLARTRRMAYVRTRSLSTLDHWREEARRLLFEIATRSGLPHPQWMRQLAYASRHAQLRHDPKPYAGPVLMVSATAPIANVYPLPHMGWGRVLAGRVELLEVPCDQVEFWADEPILERVAARIVTLLERESGCTDVAASPNQF